MKKYKYLLVLLGVVIAIVLVVRFTSNKETGFLEIEVQQGSFVISVTTSGELDSKTSTEIMGPTGLRNIGVYEDLKINSIIDEGTEVDSGDFIASLDQTPVLTKLKEVDANLEKFSAKINQSKLDSALLLRTDRDNLANLDYNVRELEIELENSKYESPVTREKLQNSIQKAKRQYAQALNNYKLKKEKEENTVRTAIIDFQKEMDKKNQFMKILDNFTIKAPQPGMLIYAKTWEGTKLTVGSKISMWNPTVAQLPDLSSMIVKTYVNEVDISQIKVGLPVEIGVDAFSEKKLHGVIKTVANIGEELKNTSAHVFEVIIDVKGMDTDLRPAMTTKNKIIVEILDSVIFVPIECINTQDSISFVYSEGKKCEVKAGKSNQDEIIILQGLKAGQKVYMVPPAGADKWSFRKLDD
jgi:hypothetical protein